MTDFTDLDVDALVERARNDPAAFAQLYRRYLTPVYRYLYRRLGNEPDAQDITSQVFVEALDGLVRGRYHQGGCFPAWLFTIARNRLTDLYRRRPVLPLDEHYSSDPGLTAAVEKGEDRERLERLLARLDEERRELLRLRFSGGLSFAEIARLEGRSEAAVKMSVYRAIEWLREHWEGDNG
ncbi:MAG: sigma-70 family RNA polymerase sigma factor [Chloroflexi bacterium]|nr:sigma-70 family RNA polymerase sigma factor [Chloroflexota bacterium]